jgi:hypothetical protein
LSRRDAKAQIEADLEARAKGREWLEKAKEYSRYDHVDVTGIVEEGNAAKVEYTVTFRISPEGVAKHDATEAVLTKQRRDFLLDSTDDNRWLGKDPYTTLIYARQFVKYDDGWRLVR